MRKFAVEIIAAEAETSDVRTYEIVVDSNYADDPFPLMEKIIKYGYAFEESKDSYVYVSPSAIYKVRAKEIND